MAKITQEQRYVGCLLGLACGDAIGTTVEFKSRDSFTPVTDMVGGGVFDLKPGEWTDDTSMALCLAQSLVKRKGFDARDQMQRYLRWYREGYMSSMATCFDIGNATKEALERFEETGEPFAGSADARSAGNGSLMRLAPVVLWFFPDVDKVIHHARLSSSTTHAASEAQQSCVVLAIAIKRALAGQVIAEGVMGDESDGSGHIQLKYSKRIQSIAEGDYRSKKRNEIRSTGYCVDSLEAALWCIHNTGNFKDAVLLAANLGDDADTVAAITGQIAGALYGVEAIPLEWREKLVKRGLIEKLALELCQLRLAA